MLEGTAFVDQFTTTPEKLNTPSKISDERAPYYFQVENDVFDSGLAARIKSSSFVVYCYLIRRTNAQKGVSWPGIRRIATDCGVALATVVSSIEELESFGVLAVERTSGKSSHYRILTAKEFEAVPIQKLNHTDSKIESKEELISKEEPTVLASTKKSPRKESTNPAHILVQTLSDATGVPVTSWPRSTKIAQGLVEAGMTPEEMVAIVPWLEKQTYWIGKGVTLPIVSSQLEQFRAARRLSKRPVRGNGERVV